MVLHYFCFNFLGPSNIAMQTQSEFLINYKWRHVQIHDKALSMCSTRKMFGTNTATCLVKINVNFSNVPCYIVLLKLYQVNLRYLQITYRNFLRESSQTVLFPISLGHVGTLTASFETAIKIHLKCIKECFWEKI